MKNMFRFLALLLAIVLISPSRSYTQAGWYWQNPLPQGNILLAVSFTGPSTGTAVGNAGTIVRTTDGGLPVQLASFTGAYVNNSVRLNWLTISEVNNYGFYVQRRGIADSIWLEVPNSFIAGHGTTNEPHDYSFTHNNIGSGSWQYRLKQVDLDGTFHFNEPITVSSPTSVKEFAPIEFSLEQNYPNPFNPLTTIEFALPKESHVKLEVYSVLGQRVATLVNEVRPVGYYAERFNASGLASGMYLYHISAGDFVKVRKLVLMK